MRSERGGFAALKLLIWGRGKQNVESGYDEKADGFRVRVRGLCADAGEKRTGIYFPD